MPRARRWESRSEYLKHWRKQNIERELAREAAWREKNRERLKEYRNDWRQKNLERERARGRENAVKYAEAHPGIIAVRNKKLYAANKEQRRERARVWAKANPEKVKAKKRRGAEQNYLCQIRITFGLTPEHYYRLMGEQNGLCRICGRINDGKRLNVDHKHVDGYEKLPRMERAMLVRGLLCWPCNVAIGQLGEDTKRLAAAIAYLEGANG